MKSLLKLTLPLLFSLGALAQTQLTAFNTLTNAQEYTFLATKAVLQQFVIYGSTNTVTLVFYDYNTNDTTNVVLPATTNMISYSTNYNTVLTNTETGFIYTNSFAGIYRTTSAVSASTNEMPRVTVVGLPANTTRTVGMYRLLSHGLTAVCYGGNVTVEADYVHNP